MIRMVRHPGENVGPVALAAKNVLYLRQTPSLHAKPVPLARRLLSAISGHAISGHAISGHAISGQLTTSGYKQPKANHMNFDIDDHCSTNS
jgi:hypothetical protein